MQVGWLYAEYLIFLYTKYSGLTLNQRSSENLYLGFQTTFLYRVSIVILLTESRLSFSNFTIPRIDSPIGVV